MPAPWRGFIDSVSLSDIYSLTTTNLSNGYIYYRKFGHIVLVSFEDLTISSNVGETIIGTMPTGYLPAWNAQPFIRDNNGNAIQSWIDRSGKIHVAFKLLNTPHAGFVVYCIP